jgi:hypothetical protein
MVMFPLQDAPATTFQDWIQQLPLAEQRLLSNVSFATCDAEQTLLQYLQLECPIYIGTDGGKQHHKGSFSWIICSPSKEQLVLHAGPVDGWHKCQSLLRSAATALASVTLYLDELATFYSLTIRSTFHLYVDSSSAISHVSHIRDLIPKRKLANHADILSTLRAAPDVLRHFLLHKVQTHQDATTEFEKLPFEAQLNVLCDRMATSQLERQGVEETERTQPCSPRPRHLLVEISLGKQNIPSHYIVRLRDELTSRRHRHFLKKKYKWTDATMEEIAWQSLSLCGNRVRTDNAANRSKLVHNWLNLGVQRAKHGTARTDILRACPYCALPEDFEHLLTCRCPQAMRLRYDATIVLKKALHDGAGDNSIFRAVQQWTLNPMAAPTVPSCASGYQPSIDRAVQSQSMIGWLNLFRGLISVQWGLISDDTANSQTRTDISQQEISHLALVIRALQDYSLAIWKSRNETLHNHAEQSRDIIHAQLHHEITNMYALRDTFSPIIQSYFSLPMAERLLCSFRQKQRWLRLVRLATSHSTSQGSRQQVMSSYFRYVSSQSLTTAPLATHSTVTVPIIPSTLQQVPIRQYFRPSLSETTTTND